MHVRKNKVVSIYPARRLVVLGCALTIFSVLLISGNTAAQGLLPPPPIPISDAAGVDLGSGYASINQNDLNIGNGTSSLSHSIGTYEHMFWGFIDDYTLSATFVTTNNVLNRFRLVGIGHFSQQFRLMSGNISAGTYEAVNGDGSQLVQLTSSTFKYTSRSGMVAMIGTPIESITYPNGYSVNIYKKGRRIQSVVSSTGLQLKYNYRNNTNTNAPTNSDDYSRFMHPSSIVAINNTVEYCDPAADTCSLVNDWPTVNYSWPTWTQLYPATGTGTAIGYFRVTDPMGRITTYTHKSFSKKVLGGEPYEPRITSIVGPQRSQTFDFKNLVICAQSYYITLEQTCVVVGANVVVTSTADGVDCTYKYTLPQTDYVGLQISSRCGNTFSSLIKDHYGTVGGPMTFMGNDVTAGYTQNDRRLLTTMAHKGKALAFDYDVRGNLITTTQTGASGTPESGMTIVAHAGFDSCNETNFKWCNKARWVETPNGTVGDYRTDYTYHDESGEVESVLAPPDQNGVRAQTTYTYTQRYASYKNSAGSIVSSSSPVWLLTEERTCTQGATTTNGCADPTKLVVTKYEYGEATGANNLWLTGVVTTANGKSRRACYKYDALGNQIAVTTPRANLTSCE